MVGWEEMGLEDKLPNHNTESGFLDIGAGEPTNTLGTVVSLTFDGNVYCVSLKSEKHSKFQNSILIPQSLKFAIIG